MSAARQWGNDGNFDSSLRTKNRQTRVVYSNVLAQRTQVQTQGKPFMVIQGGTVGQGGPVNTFSIAANTGSLNLTQAEFTAVVDANTGLPTITFERGVNPMPQNQYTILPGYTSIAYTVIGGGGGGGGTAGSGGGAGGAVIGTFPVNAGNVIQVYFSNTFDSASQGSGGAGGVDASDGSNGDRAGIAVKENMSAGSLFIMTATGFGGIGRRNDGSGGVGGEWGTGHAPATSFIAYDGNNGENKGTNGGNGGTLGGGLTKSYGGGGGGAGGNTVTGGLGFNGGNAGNGTNTGGNGGNPYYKIVIT